MPYLLWRGRCRSSTPCTRLRRVAFLQHRLKLLAHLRQKLIGRVARYREVYGGKSR